MKALILGGDDHSDVRPARAHIVSALGGDEPVSVIHDGGPAARRLSDIRPYDQVRIDLPALEPASRVKWLVGEYCPSAVFVFESDAFPRTQTEHAVWDVAQVCDTAHFVRRGPDGFKPV